VGFAQRANHWQVMVSGWLVMVLLYHAAGTTGSSPGKDPSAAR
jgi:hypothetical protein